MPHANKSSHAPSRWPSDVEYLRAISYPSSLPPVVVQHIKGTWKKGIVRGKLEKMGWGAAMGYNGFTHVRREEQEEIEAHILLSDELDKNWPLIDEFEGDEYRRVLAVYEGENREAGVGFIYAVNRP